MSNGGCLVPGRNRPGEREWPGNKTLKASYADRERRDIALVDASSLALYLIFIRVEAPKIPGPALLCSAMSDEIKCNVTAVHYTDLSHEKFTTIWPRLPCHTVVISTYRLRLRGSGHSTLFFHIFLSPPDREIVTTLSDTIER